MTDLLDPSLRESPAPIAPTCHITAGCKNSCAPKKKGGHFRGCKACLDRKNNLPCNVKRKDPQNVSKNPDGHTEKKQRMLDHQVISGRIGSEDAGAQTVLVKTRNQGNWDLAIHNHNAIVDTFNYLVAAASTFVTKPLSLVPLAVPCSDAEGLALLHKTPALYQVGISTPITSDASPSTIAKEFLPEEWTGNTKLQTQDMSQLPKALVEGSEPPDPEFIKLGDILKQFDTSTKGYNCLEIPGAPLKNPDDCFMHDMLAYDIGMRHIKKNKTLFKDWNNGEHSPGRQLKKFGSFRLASTAGTITGEHEDGSGSLTMLEVDYGLKVWSIFHPDKASAEHLILRPGDRLIMISGTPHSVYTPEPTLCSGRHFLHYDFLKAIYKAAARQAKEPISNEYIPAVGLLLCFMALALADDSFVERLQLRPKLGQYAAELETMLQSYDLLFPVPREDHENDMKLYRGIKQAVAYTKELALETLAEIKRTVWLNE